MSTVLYICRSMYQSSGRSLILLYIKNPQAEDATAESGTELYQNLHRPNVPNIVMMIMGTKFLGSRVFFILELSPAHLTYSIYTQDVLKMYSRCTQYVLNMNTE